MEGMNAAPQSSEQLNELAAALAKAQGVIRGAAKDTVNPHFKSRYADLAAVWEACREALSANGLAVIQTPQMTGENIVLVTKLVHASGQWVEARYPVWPVQNTPQGYGSALTYARRYSLAAMVGVAPADEDDDGNAASAGPPPRQQQQSRPAPQQQRAAQPTRAANKWDQAFSSDEPPPPSDFDEPAPAPQVNAAPPKRTTKIAEVPDGATQLPADVVACSRYLAPYAGKDFARMQERDLKTLARVLDQLVQQAKDPDNRVNLSVLSSIVNSELAVQTSAPGAGAAS